MFANQKLKVNVCPNLIVKRASTSEPDYTFVICNLDELSLVKPGKLADSENQRILRVVKLQAH